MNHIVAYELLTAELSAFSGFPFQELGQLIGERSSRLVHGRDGVDYDLTAEVRWRSHPEGDICVTAFIGEANWGSPHDTLDDTVVIPNPGPTSA